jgi:hypothetical protein
MINWIGFGRKRLWSNRGTIPEFLEGWKKTLWLAVVPIEIRTEAFPNTSLQLYILMCSTPRILNIGSTWRWVDSFGFRPLSPSGEPFVKSHCWLSYTDCVKYEEYRSFWLLAWLIVLPWRWRQYISSKRQYASTKLHGVTTQIIVYLYTMDRHSRGFTMSGLYVAR